MLMVEETVPSKHVISMADEASEVRSMVRLPVVSTAVTGPVGIPEHIVGPEHSPSRVK